MHTLIIILSYQPCEDYGVGGIFGEVPNPDLYVSLSGSIDNELLSDCVISSSCLQLHYV